MTTEQIILSRLQKLTPDSQQQVLNLIESLSSNLSSQSEIADRSTTFSPVDSSSAEWEKAMKQISENQPQSLGELLRSWEEEGTPEEQQETWEFLHQALDKDRISNRPLFP
jgi:septation ring formation regulator EzrA